MAATQPEMRPALPSLGVNTSGRRTYEELGERMGNFARAFLPDNKLWERRSVLEMVPQLVASKMAGNPEDMKAEKWRTVRPSETQDHITILQLVEGVPSDPALWSVVTGVAAQADNMHGHGDTIGVRGSVGMVAAFVNYALQQEGTPMQVIDADIIASARDAFFPSGDDTSGDIRRSSALWHILSGQNAIKLRLMDASDFDMLQIIDSALSIYDGWSASQEDAIVDHHRDDLAIVTYLTIVDAQLRRNRAAKAPVPLY